MNRNKTLAPLTTALLLCMVAPAGSAFAQNPPATPPANPAPPAPPAAPATPPAPAAPAAPAPTPVTIPEETEVKVALKNELKSGTAKEGDTVPFTVVKDVIGANGQVLIKAGTPAVGHVLQSKPHGFIGKPGKLEFTCDYVAMPDGTHVPLRSAQKTKYGQDNRTASVAAAVVLTPVALLLPGKDTTARAGQEFTLYVNQNTPVAAAPTATVSSASTPAPPGAAVGAKSSFQLSDGTAVVGTLSSFDGTTYTITTDSGSRQIKASEVKSISPVK